MKETIQIREKRIKNTEKGKIKKTKIEKAEKESKQREIK